MKNNFKLLLIIKIEDIKIKFFSYSALTLRCIEKNVIQRTLSKKKRDVVDDLRKNSLVAARSSTCHKRPTLLHDKGGFRTQGQGNRVLLFLIAV